VADPATALRAGLADRYRVERELGRGGMARVYLARDLRHDRPVALKVLHPELGAALGAERFLREVRTAARLQHPNILTVFDSGTARPAPGETGGPVLWYSMPYIDGESLRDRLRREVQLPVDEAVAIAREVAEALDYAHGRDVLHRDIKPENILLSRGHALVGDFGIARALGDDRSGAERLTQTGLALGTPTYMSPEQASGADRLDARSDVYSLGCVLFEMLAGEPPFTGPTAQSVIAKRFTEAAPSPSRGGRTLPPQLDRLVRRALAPSPVDRFPSAGAMAAALGTGGRWPAQGGEPGESPRGPDPSIAVLPFANLSRLPEDEYFADGMTDELINALAKEPGLHVVSRTSCFAFKGRLEDAREIGRRLHVATVLEGSVRRAGHRLRVASQLINVADGFLLWSETFDREAEDVFAIQDEIARAIGGALRGRLLAPGRSSAIQRPTHDLQAYQLYLKGRQFWNRRTEQDLGLALQCFQQALARDSGFALAHAGLADTWALLGFYSAAPPAEVFPRVKQAAHAALALQPARPRPTRPSPTPRCITTGTGRRRSEASGEPSNCTPGTPPRTSGSAIFSRSSAGRTRPSRRSSGPSPSTRSPPSSTRRWDGGVTSPGATSAGWRSAAAASSWSRATWWRTAGSLWGWRRPATWPRQWSRPRRPRGSPGTACPAWDCWATRTPSRGGAGTRGKCWSSC